MKSRTCCFTGHRPEKLAERQEIIITALRKAILDAINDGYTNFITGMAYGVDIWAAEIILSLKSSYDLKLICAIPHPHFENICNAFWKEKYYQVLTQADEVNYILPHYTSYCLRKRNNWMVEHSSLIIAVYNGSKGGTKNTIDYAIKNNIKVINALNYQLLINAQE